MQTKGLRRDADATVCQAQVLEVDQGRHARASTVLAGPSGPARLRAAGVAVAFLGTSAQIACLLLRLAVEDPALTRASLRGELRQEEATKAEQGALTALRAFDSGKLKLEAAVEAVMVYQRMYQTAKAKPEKALHKALADTEDRVRRTLSASPWKACPCRVCRESGVEVIIFRSSNRNKRRGFHNLYVYSEHVARISGEVRERKTEYVKEEA